MRRKDTNTKAKFFSIFIVVIMTASVLGFFIGGGDDVDQTLNYNDYKFVRKGNEWMVFFGENKLIFDYYPEQVLDIEVSEEISSKFDSLEVDLTYDVDAVNKEAIALSHFRIKESLETVSNVYVRQGASSENEFYLPIITCADSTESVPVFYFKESNETKIYTDGNCVMIEASSEFDFLRIKDRLLYSYFDIIK